MRRFLIFCALSLVSALPVQSEDVSAPPREFRTHYEFQSVTGLDDFTATIIRRDAGDHDGTTALIEDSHGNRFVFKWEREYVHQTSSREIRELRNNEFVRYTLWLPFTARTRKATSDQAHAHPELMDDKNSRFELAASGNAVISGILEHWKDVQTAREWRSRIRSMLTPSFLESLEVMETAGLFRVPDLLDLDYLLLPHLLYRTECEPRMGLQVKFAVADCGFDKRFGFDCSDKQRERVEKAAAATPPLARPY